MAPHAAVLTDYDGTLAPIVADPDRAVPHPKVPALLAGLVTRYARVGVVSGRPVSFLRRHLPVEGVVLVGQYGLERWDGHEVVTDPAVGPFRAAVAAVVAEAATDLGPRGIRVECKGDLAVALHWREHREAGALVRAWAGEAARRHGLALVPGRLVAELRPPVPVGKGTVVTELCTGCRAALFCGDDVGDLDAFDALRRLAARGELTVAVRVGVRSEEMPAGLGERTDLVVDGPEGVVALLADLVGRATG